MKEYNDNTMKMVVVLVVNMVVLLTTIMIMMTPTMPFTYTVAQYVCGVSGPAWHQR